MADDSTGTITVNNKEEIQNQENENNENALMEIEGSKMEVDQTDNVKPPLVAGIAGSKDDDEEDEEDTTVATIAVKTESTTQQEEDQQKELSTSVQDVPMDNVVSISSADKEDQLLLVGKVKVEEAEEGISTTNNHSEETSSPPPPASQENVTSINAQPKTNVKVEIEDGQDGDSYMILEEADGNENDSDLSDEEELELTENEQLRKANLELSERLALLEEFIEVEFSEKFSRFIKKRAHLVDVLGIAQGDTDAKCNGKRSSKSLELVGLLKIVKDQARSNGSPQKYEKSETREKRSTQNNVSSSTKGQTTTGGNDATAKKEELVPGAKPKRCHRCRATGHFVRECPLPIDPRDRRVILRKEKRDSRKEKRERDRLEGIQNPTIKAMRDRRRRITRALNRERQKMK